MRFTFSVLLPLVLLAACASPSGTGPAVVGPEPGFEPIAARLTAAIEYELDDKGLPAISIALVDDQRTVWAAGFGEEDPEAGVAADASTIYRVGSVSKLFTDLAVMKLVERGVLDLDAPVTEYLPEFAIGPPMESVEASEGEGAAPRAAVPTLRQLMSHRAGIVREPPVGHYFDDAAPTLAATVTSLIGSPRIYPAGERVKYSNAGIATVGYVLERTQATPFADYLQQEVLRPLGMERSAFVPTEAVRSRLAKARMWSYDGREFAAPTFELGMAPAGSMYSPVPDLAKFMSALFRGGVVVTDSTLAEMLSPQFEESSSFGIGFALGELDGRRFAGHGGAIYGFATQLSFLPDDRMGAVAVTTMDVANDVVDRLADYALRLMLAARDGDPLPDYDRMDPIPEEMAAQLFAAWGPEGGPAVFKIYPNRDGEPYLDVGSARLRLRTKGDGIYIEDRQGRQGPIYLTGGGLDLGGGVRFAHLGEWPGPKPAAAPERFLDLIGEYGWDHDILFVFEKEGRLEALIEWVEVSALTEVAPDTFAFPPAGNLYHGERVVFERDAAGRVTAAITAGIRFERRSVGTADGATFTITPLRPPEELREEALAAEPPVENDVFRAPDLVELGPLDPGIRYDIRYATTNNFMQSVFYDEARAFLQRPAADALVRAHRALASRGYGLLIHDAYRPWYVTKMFWDATPASDRLFVANPARGSRHNRGAAVDLTLYNLETGEPIQMVGGYDEFSERSFPDYIGGTSLQRWHQALLRAAMEAEGFSVERNEWWHFDYDDWRSYPILNEPFHQIPD